jgi:hypothetical protein
MGSGAIIDEFAAAARPGFGTISVPPNLLAIADGVIE